MNELVAPESMSACSLVAVPVSRVFNNIGRRKEFFDATSGSSAVLSFRGR